MLDDQPDGTAVVVNDGERCHRPRDDAQVADQPISAAERKAPRAKTLAEVLEVDLAILGANDQPHSPLLVAQEQILGVATGKLDAHRLRFLDRGDRRVVHRIDVDPEVGEMSQLPTGLIPKHPSRRS